MGKIIAKYVHATQSDLQISYNLYQNSYDITHTYTHTYTQKKIIQKSQNTLKSPITTGKENKVGDIILLNFEWYYNAIAIKTHT
jgi:hypothetical protein